MPKCILSALLVLVLLLSAVPSRAQSRVDTPNIDSFGRGYDMLSADPLDLQGTAKAKIFNTDCTVKVDGTNWNRPSGMDIQRNPWTMAKSESHFSLTAWDYQQESKENVTVDAGVPEVFSFSESLSFSQFRQDKGSKESFTVVTQQRRRTYTATLRSYPQDPLKLDQDFEDDVRSLPLTYDAGSKAAFWKIIAIYGTHFASTAEFGGMGYMTKVMSMSTYSSLEKDSVDIEAGASGTYEGISGGARGSWSETNTKAFSSETRNSTTKLDYHGGVPSEHVDKDGNVIWDGWLPTVDANPSLVTVNLAHLADALQPEYFNQAIDAGELKQRADALRIAITDYLNEKGIPLEDLTGVGPVYYYHYSDSRDSVNWGNVEQYLYRYSPKKGKLECQHGMWKLGGVAFLAMLHEKDGWVEQVPRHDPNLYGEGDNDGSTCGACHSCTVFAFSDIGNISSQIESDRFWTAPGSGYWTQEIHQYGSPQFDFPVCPCIQDTSYGIQGWSYFPEGQAPEGWTDGGVAFYAVNPLVSKTGQ